MRYAKLGNSELNVSRICMGCMGFGDAKKGQHTWIIDEEHTREIIRKGLESGINFYDTAIGYQSGTSEQYLGRALRDYAKLKYNGTADEDSVIIARVAELAEKRGVSMTEISLAWLLTKVTAPIVGADKGRDRLSGRTVCAPRIGGRYGAEYSRAGKGKHVINAQIS